MTVPAWSSTPSFGADQKDRWITVTWAAKHYGISRASLWEWVKSGEVESRQKPASGHYLVSERSLRAKLFGGDVVRT